ncbi:MAG: SDR family oxidoreductase [Ottowia sp.]|uniref:SDR family oxidoreductase n=1 Tax=unclassified Ottowia TaxID=2645081 RepID=UPI003C2DF81C
MSNASTRSSARRAAIVTGAGSGIGKAAALALLADGWQVALAGRRAGPLQQVIEESGAGARALAVPTDVADSVAVKHLFDEAVNAFGRVDLLFNNAGTGAPAVPLDELTAEQWRTVVDVNLSGMFYCMQAAFRVMKSQSPRGGRIINNGSISAYAPRPHSIAYTATKHAVTGLTKTGALDGRAHDIAVGQIDIGNAATEMTERMAAGILQANGQTMEEPRMDVAVVGQSVVYMANLPLQANVLFHTVMATKMPFVGRG